MTIAITGSDSAATGWLGRRLVEAAASSGQDVVRLIDTVAHASNAPEAGVGIRELTAALAGVDAVIHLPEVERTHPAGTRWSLPWAKRWRLGSWVGWHDRSVSTVDVDGTLNVCAAAAAAGARQIVVASSVLVYGADSDTEVPLTEISSVPELSSTPTADGFDLADEYRHLEHQLEDWRTDNRQLSVAVMRVGLLAGAEVDTFVTRAFEAPRIPFVKGHRPPMQLLHPDDAASALLHAADTNLDGVFNVAAEGWLAFDEVSDTIGRSVVEVPEELAYSSVEGLWELGLGDLPPGALAWFVYPSVMDGSKLTATGWRPQHSTKQALVEMAKAHKRYVSIGAVRADKRALGIAALVAMLVSVAVTVVVARQIFVRAKACGRRACAFTSALKAAADEPETPQALRRQHELGERPGPPEPRELPGDPGQGT